MCPPSPPPPPPHPACATRSLQEQRRWPAGKALLPVSTRTESNIATTGNSTKWHRLRFQTVHILSGSDGSYDRGSSKPLTHTLVPMFGRTSNTTVLAKSLA